MPQNRVEGRVGREEETEGRTREAETHDEMINRIFKMRKQRQVRKVRGKSICTYKERWVCGLCMNAIQHNNEPHESNWNFVCNLPGSENQKYLIYCKSKVKRMC